MKTTILITALAMALIALTPDKALACDGDPVAVISPSEDPYRVGLGDDVEFSASGSYDTDEEGESIDEYSWSFPGGDPDSSTDENVTVTYNTIGVYTATLTVTDDESVESEEVERDIYVIKVTEVVNASTGSGEQQYVAVNSSMQLEAKHNLSGGFPDGEPAWTFTQPTGASATLSPTSGSANTTISNMDKPGDYVVTAKCGSGDNGDSITITAVEITDIDVVNSAGVNNTVLGHVSCSIEPPDQTVIWSIEGDDLGCNIAEDGTNTLAKITPATTGGTITVRATASGVSGTCYGEIDLDVVKISNMTFSPAAIATVASGTDETVATVTVVPSGRTMSWEILTPDLGCDVSSATSTTADIDAGMDAGTVTVRAKDSEIESCYLDDTLDVVGVELTGQPDPGELCLVYTGSYPELYPDDHPEAGEPLHGTEPTISFTVEGTPSGGTYLWVPVDESDYGKLEIVDGEPSSTVTFRGARESTLIEDALFSVYYTVNGCTSEGQYGYTVSRPDHVTYLEGTYRKAPAWVGQSFYFQIEDQLDNDINVEGITCWEKLTTIAGPRGEEEYNITQIYHDDNPDNQYNGEIVSKDRLQTGRSEPYVERTQKLYVGGWHVATYTLYLYYHLTPGVRRE